MHKTLLLTAFNLTIYILNAQTPESIITGLKTINTNVINQPCNTGKGNLISNRAMNIFLSNKVGTYLSDDDDLSLYKNSVRFNTVEGTFSITHNLRQATGLDEPVKSFVNIGARANVLNGILSRHNNTHFTNDFGFLLKKTWMGKTNTNFDKCDPGTGATGNHKQLMDMQRAAILHAIEAEIKERDSIFNRSLAAVDTKEIPGQTADEAGGHLRKYFYKNLNEEYSRRFAELQSEALINTNNFSLVTTSWTIASVYIPILLEKLYVAPSYLSNFESRFLYPLEFSLTHTRFWESSKSGRFILRLNGKLFANNSYRSRSLQKISLADYKAAGGKDTAHIREQNSNELLIGLYHNFLTPQLNVNIVWIPATSHFGLSGYIEQNFGKYNALNGKIGFPIELIDKKGDPDLTFEFQVRFFDLRNEVQPAVKVSDKTSIGFSIAVPFSKIVY